MPLVARYVAPPFKVQIMTAILGPNQGLDWAGFWAGYGSPDGAMVSPVNSALFVKLVNRQGIPSQIESFREEIYCEHSNWQRLVYVDARHNDIYWASQGLAHAVKLDVASNSLDYKLQSTTIQPHDTVEGWVFSSLPKGTPLPSGTCSFRFLIRDTSGVDFLSFASRPERLSQGEASLTPSTMGVIGPVDFSSAHRAYYDDLHR